MDNLVIKHAKAIDPESDQPLRQVIRAKTVGYMTGYDPTWAYTAHTRCPSFPKRIRLGVCGVGWYRDEVEAWIASRERGTVCRPKYERQPVKRQRIVCRNDKK